MKIVRFHEYGDPDVLRVEDAPLPVPGPGEVRVRAEAIGVGAPDILVRTGTDVKTWPLPMTPGNDMAGIVDAVGEGVTRFREGDRVYVASRELPLRGGNYAEARTVPANALFAIPDGVAADQIVALGNYHVAWMLLNHAVQLKPGDTILIHAAAGGIGSALVQLAKLHGLTVFGIAGGPDKARYVTEMGADAAIDRHVDDVGDRVAALTAGNGVNCIFDSVAGPAFSRNFDMLATAGTLVQFGFLAGQPDPDIHTAMARDFTRNLTFRIFSIHYFDDKPDIRRAAMEQMIEALAAGRINPRIHARMKLEDAAAAHRVLESGTVIGKLVLIP
ncbi:MAG: zinc-dependent alcohol dehydrogenase family protein [Proteobacteria bacterium]|nr:zinc-dependent alcohol dehydrogenase family protein [Pseudomonadota bacterium]